MSEILHVSNVTKKFFGFTALSNVDLKVHQGERIGLIGPNGSGKTTLINCISGVLRVDDGEMRFLGDDISKHPTFRRARAGIARTFQIPSPFHTMSVLQNLMVPLDYIVHGMVDRTTSGTVHDEARALLCNVRLDGRASVLAGELSQVELRKLELARAIAARPKLLICDEAMAGLAAREVDEILNILLELNAAGITIIMVEHIMQAVMRFSQRIVCLSGGRIICDGLPDDVMSNPEVRRAYLGN
jgi:branched-chain amino acid transport system ATP-binding protein